MLVYYSRYVMQEFIGQFCPVDRSAIEHSEAYAVPLFAVRRKPGISRKGAKALIVDYTEQPIQRPWDDTT